MCKSSLFKQIKWFLCLFLTKAENIKSQEMGRNEIISLELHLRTFLLSAGDGMLPRRHLLSHKCSPPGKRKCLEDILENIFGGYFLADIFGG